MFSWPTRLLVVWKSQIKAASRQTAKNWFSLFSFFWWASSNRTNLSRWFLPKNSRILPWAVHDPISFQIFKVSLDAWNHPLKNYAKSGHIWQLISFCRTVWVLGWDCHAVLGAYVNAWSSLSWTSLKELEVFGGRLTIDLWQYSVHPESKTCWVTAQIEIYFGHCVHCPTSNCCYYQLYNCIKPYSRTAMLHL